MVRRIAFWALAVVGSLILTGNLRADEMTGRPMVVIIGIDKYQDPQIKSQMDAARKDGEAVRDKTEAAMIKGGPATATLNAANEVAVEAFLDRRIGFLEIAGVVDECLQLAERSSVPCNTSSIDDILNIDGQARRLARERVQALH